MADTTTTYMLLVVPEVSVKVGPDWAQSINTALARIDLHDHSTDLGVKITPAGMNINDDLDLDDNDLENVGAVYLTSLGGTLGSTNTGVLYRVGTNLYYNNGSGSAVQITSGSSVNTSGSGEITASAIGAYPYTVVTGDAQKVLIVDTSSARTINLPAASNAMFFMLKDGTGSAETNNISVVPDGTDLIEGSNSTYALNTGRGSWGFVSDGATKWYIV